MQTPRNHCHTDGDLTYLDYFGRALAVYDRSRHYVTVESVDTHRLHEITYLLIEKLIVVAEAECRQRKPRRRARVD